MKNIIIMMCFHRGPLVKLHNAFSHFFDKFLYRFAQNLFTCKST